MELFRVGHDEWGRRLIEGISWDLLPIAVGVGVVVIVGHAIYKIVRKLS